MANTKFSELSQASSVTTHDLIAISQDQGGETYVDGSRYVIFNDFKESVQNNVKSIQFDLNYEPPTHSTGLMHWNSNEGTVEIGMLGGDVFLQLGQEQHTWARNDSGVEILNGEVVYVSGTQGDRPKITLANASSASTSKIIGVATENIPNGEDGYVTTSGIVREINTSAFAPGDIVYLSNVAGELTNLFVSPPAYIVKVGVCLRSDVAGSILVNTGLCFADTRLNNLTVYNSAILTHPVNKVSSDYTVDYTTDNKILANASSAPFTITLPLVANASGRQFTIKKIDSTGNAITVDGNGSETIDGQLTQIINAQYVSMDIFSDGTEWFII